MEEDLIFPLTVLPGQLKLMATATITVTELLGECFYSRMTLGITWKRNDDGRIALV